MINIENACLKFQNHNYLVVKQRWNSEFRRKRFQIVCRVMLSVAEMVKAIPMKDRLLRFGVRDDVTFGVSFILNFTLFFFLAIEDCINQECYAKM